MTKHVKKVEVIHLADFNKGIDHHSLCGKVFTCETGLPHNMTGIVKDVTCHVCRRRIEGAKVKSNVTVVEQPNPRLSQPVAVDVLTKDVIDDWEKIWQTDNAPRVLDLSIGKFRVFINMNEAEMLAEKLDGALDKVKEICKIFDKVNEIDSYLDSMQSTLDAFRNDPVYAIECLGGDLEGDLRDLTEAIESLDS